jgi:hypothetical protein
MHKKLNSLFISTILACSMAPYATAGDQQGKDKDKPARDVPGKPKKDAPNKDFPNSGRASPQGRTEAARKEFLKAVRKEYLKRESLIHPNSYKNTREYKNASPEVRREVDAAVERNRKALEQWERQKNDKKKTLRA